MTIHDNTGISGILTTKVSRADWPFRASSVPRLPFARVSVQVSVRWPVSTPDNSLFLERNSIQFSFSFSFLFFKCSNFPVPLSYSINKSNASALAPAIKTREEFKKSFQSSHFQSDNKSSTEPSSQKENGVLNCWWNHFTSLLFLLSFPDAMIYWKEWPGVLPLWRHLAGNRRNLPRFN